MHPALSLGGDQECSDPDGTLNSCGERAEKGQPLIQIPNRQELSVFIRFLFPTFLHKHPSSQAFTHYHNMEAVPLGLPWPCWLAQAGAFSVFPLSSIWLQVSICQPAAFQGLVWLSSQTPRAFQHAGTRPRHLSHCQSPLATHTLCAPYIYTCYHEDHSLHALVIHAACPYTSHHTQCTQLAHT